MSYIFKSQTPFLSTGNFDKIPEQIAAAIDQQKHMSCGNFITSTKDENWDQILDEFRMSRFNAGTLTHCPQNGKYNIGNEDCVSYTQNRRQTIRSQQEIDEFTESKKPEKVKTTQQRSEIDRHHQQNKRPSLSGFYHSNLSQGQQTISKPLNRESSDDDESANEYDLASEGDEDRQRSQSVSLHQLEERMHMTCQTTKIEDVFINLKDNCLSQMLKKKTNKNLDQFVMVDEEKTDQNEYYSTTQILEMSLDSKESSIKVQAYLKTLDSMTMNQVAHYLCCNIKYMLMDKFGNYVVQFLSEIHQPSHNYLVDLCLNNFVEFAENEYGSRIMQKLARINPGFCRRALEIFSQSFDRLIKNITGSILICKLISSAQFEGEYYFCLYVLEKNREYLRKTYFNRMLVTLVGCCSDELSSHIVYYVRQQV